MEVVYPYKAVPGDWALRYSLRSLANLEHSRVIVSGDMPRTLSCGGFVHHRVPKCPDRWRSSRDNIEAAARDVVQGEKFVVMNDDIFLLGPWDFRHENRGTIADYLGSGSSKGEYRQRVEDTFDILRGLGVAEPLFYGLHTPTVYERAKLLDLVADLRGKTYLLRTVYHNLFPSPSVRAKDVKIRQWTGQEAEGLSVLSITDGLARDPRFTAWMHARFPDACRYEPRLSRGISR